jgi:hypothetical protein
MRNTFLINVNPRRSQNLGQFWLVRPRAVSHLGAPAFYLMHAHISFLKKVRQTMSLWK